MPEIRIDSKDSNILRKIMPLICLAIPWEIYFYTNYYSNGWGIKFSVFYANFDIEYGTIFVSMLKQMTLLSYGGFLPSVRTLGWIIGAVICIALAIYELLKEEIDVDIDYGMKSTGIVLIACGIITFISSVAVWNATFKTVPVAPVFFIAFGYLLLRIDEKEVASEIRDLN